MERDSMVIYRSMMDAAAILPDSQRLEVYEAVMRYGMYGIEPEALSREAALVFACMKPLIDTNTKRYLDGKKGGRPKETKPMVKPLVKPLAKPNDNVNVNDNENVDVNDNDNVGDADTRTRASDDGAEFAITEKFYEELKAELLGDTMTLTELQRQYGKTRGELLRYLDTYQRNNRIERHTHSTRSDFRKHFNSWLRIQVQNNQSPDQSKPTTAYKTETEKILHNADTFTADTAGTDDLE